MNFIDIILGGLILFGFVRGLMKGLFVEIASLVALIAGIYGAIHFSYFAGDFLSEQFTTWEEKYINLTAFAITFVVILVAITMVGKLLTKIADFAALGILNKILGDLFTNKLNINRNKDIILNGMKNCKTGHSHKYLPENKFDIYTKSGTFKNFRHEHNVFYYKSKLYGLTFLSKSS